MSFTDPTKDHMAKTRRQSLAQSSIGLMAVAVSSAAQQQPESTPGAPPAFGTAPPVGPAVNAQHFTEAETLVQVEMSSADREVAASNWRMQMAPLYERRVGPRKLALES